MDVAAPWSLLDQSPLRASVVVARRLSTPLTLFYRREQQPFFECAGSMRRVGFHRGLITGLSAFAVGQSFAASAPATGYDGLDGFGRVAELTYTGPASGGGTSVRHSYEYGYDLVDQPIWKDVTQVTYAGQSHGNQRS